MVYRRKRNNETVHSDEDEGSMWGCNILGTHFKFKKIFEGKSVVTNGDLWALLEFRTPLVLLMILMQNFILINNHMKPQA